MSHKISIAVVAPVLNPELVILGGGVTRDNGDQLLDPLQQELRGLSPFRPRIVVSELGEEAVLAGAVAVSLEAAQARLFDRGGRRSIKDHRQSAVQGTGGRPS